MPLPWKAGVLTGAASRRTHGGHTPPRHADGSDGEEFVSSTLEYERFSRPAEGLAVQREKSVEREGASHMAANHDDEQHTIQLGEHGHASFQDPPLSCSAASARSRRYSSH